MLTAARFTAAPQEDAPLCGSKRRADPAPRCALALLRGLEDSVLRLIADFAGVVRGRQLRNAQEALRMFGDTGEFENGDDEDGNDDTTMARASSGSQGPGPGLWPI